MVSSNSNNDSPSNVPGTSIQFSSQLLNSPVIAGLVTALITIVAPNAQAIAVSISKGISLGNARTAIEQARLWQENFDCAKTQQIKDFQTANNAKLSVTVCDSGDMLVQVSESSKKEARWVSFESLYRASEPKVSATDPLLQFFASPAIAASTSTSSVISVQERDDSQNLAQATVICQENLEGGRIRRVLKYLDGSCVIEEVNTFTGEVTSASGACESC